MSFAELGKNSPKVTLGTLIDAYDDIDGRSIIDVIREVLSATLGQRLDDKGIYVNFPVIYQSEDQDDPLALRISLSLADEDDVNDPYWTIKLSDILEEYIEDARDDGSYGDGLLRIADAMIALAEKIKASVAAGQEQD